MNRRDFLRRSALIAAGVVAADQIDLLERLGEMLEPRRLLFPGWSPPKSGGYIITSANWDKALQDQYVNGKFWGAVNSATPFMDELRKRESQPRKPQQPGKSSWLLS